MPPKHKTQVEWALVELAEQILEPVNDSDPCPDPYVIEDILVYMGSPYVGPNEADNNAMRKMYCGGYISDEDREGDFEYNLTKLSRWPDEDVSDTLLAFRATYRVTYQPGEHEEEELRYLEQEYWEANDLRKDWDF